MNQPDERPCLGLQGSQAVLQLLISAHEVHSPHCDVQQPLAPPQQQKPLVLLSLLLQYLLSTPLFILVSRRPTVQTVLTSILVFLS